MVAPAPDWILALHVGATLAMTGLIWFVQVVHYPLYSLVGEDSFRAYHELHVQRTTRVVAGPMLVELGTAAWLYLAPNEGFSSRMAGLGLVLLAIIWLSTALLQVPSHGRLQHGYSSAPHRFLVATNWIRTTAWTLRAALVLWAVIVQPRAA